MCVCARAYMYDCPGKLVAVDDAQPVHQVSVPSQVRPPTNAVGASHVSTLSHNAATSVASDGFNHAKAVPLVASAAQKGKELNGKIVSQGRRKSKTGKTRAKRKGQLAPNMDAPTTSDAGSEVGSANQASAPTDRNHDSHTSSPRTTSESTARGSGQHHRDTLNSVEYDSEASGGCADSEGSGSDDTTASIQSYRPPRLPVGEDGSLKMMMSRVVSPSEFYAHVVAEEPVNHMNVITDMLSRIDTDSDVDVFVPRICQPCCARFLNDEAWYRAVCVGQEASDDGSSTVSKVTVHYVDYGEVETVPISHIRRLPDELLYFPILAVRCSLAVVELEEDDDDADEDHKVSTGLSLVFQLLFLCSSMHVNPSVAHPY